MSMSEWKNEGKEGGSSKRKKEKMNLNVCLGQQDSLTVQRLAAKANSDSLAGCKGVVQLIFFTIFSLSSFNFNYGQNWK